MAPGVADITQHRTWEGWLYLAVVVDAWSRKVVGWAMANHVRAELVVEALEMAVAVRRPERGVVHHSDQGCQYTSLAFGRALRVSGVTASMGTAGDCFDNALAESFFATLQTELLDRHHWSTRRQLQSAIFDFIEALSRYAGDPLAGRLSRSGCDHHRDRRPVCRSSLAWFARLGSCR